MQSRKNVVTEGVSGYYHCISRCVRRAFLCGKDTYSKKNFDHRKLWIRDRLTVLVEAFAIELVAYAILSNHLHSVLKTRPDLASQWSDEEVAHRWLTIFPRRLRIGDEEAHRAQQIRAIASNPEKVATYRARLTSLSWFNRCLNEHIARRSNKEDDVTGRFWEGRFKCQFLVDERAVLTCSVYVDLNETRAGVAQTPEASTFSSIHQRIQEAVDTSPSDTSSSLPPLLGIAAIYGGRISFEQYLNIVDQTARVYVDGKSSLHPKLESILSRIGVSSSNWSVSMKSGFTRKFPRIVGTAAQIREHATCKGRRWFHGIQSAKKLFCSI